MHCPCIQLGRVGGKVYDLSKRAGEGRGDLPQGKVQCWKPDTCIQGARGRAEQIGASFIESC